MTSSTTDTTARTEPDAGPSTGARHRGRTVILLALLLAVLGAICGSAAAAAWDKGYDGRILPGVRVGVVDVSGMTRDGAAAALAVAYPLDKGQVVLRTPVGDMPIPYAAFGRRLDVDPLVEAAMAAGRSQPFPARLVDEVRQAVDGLTLEPVMVLDTVALATTIRTALAPLATTPVDATVTMGRAGPVTTSGRAGRAVDPEPAVAAATAAAGAIDAPALVVVPAGVTSIEPGITNAEVAAAIAEAGRLAAADVILTYRKSTWTIKASTIHKWVTFSTAGGTVTAEADPALVPPTLKPIGRIVAVPPESAIFLHTRSGRIFGVAPGTDGRALDPVATAARVVSELAARAGGAPATPVKVAWMPVAPKLTTEAAQQTAPLMTMLGTWTTWFPISDHNFYGANIWVPARLINGMVLRPGETFDWWDAVGPVSTATGFGPGGVIRGSHTDPTGALGGGMCSSSTTLFNAALRAGLQMGARDNHKYYINRYPLGLDATVWIMGGGKQSMSFTNDTPNPIYIRGIKTRSGSTGYVTYELWGIPDGRTTTIGRPTMRNVVRATTSIEYVSTLPHGQRQQVEYPSNEMDVEVSRVVKDARGHVIHAEIWQTHYVLWNGIIQVGL